MKSEIIIPTGEQFLSLSKPERLELIKSLLDDDNAHTIVSDVLTSIAKHLEHMITDTNLSQTKRDAYTGHLSDILELQTYVPIRGSSLKMIMEYVTYLL